MLIAPSWGGMLNGLLTLRGAFDKVKTDPILKFMVVAVTAYGMATFEGPMLSVKLFNSLTHYTDWTIAHVHIGALGWNGFLTFGILYWIIPKLYNTKLHSKKLAEWHFWVGIIGIVLYAIPMYWTGFTQGMMWRQFDQSGMLLYPNFLETVTQLMPMYLLRSLGGLVYLLGVVFMIVNLWKTAKSGKLVRSETYQAPAITKKYKAHAGEGKLRFLERMPLTFHIAVLGVILVGGLVEMVPLFTIKSNVPTIASVSPYTPLELQGRDLYVREGCYTCHSRMIRPFRWETERYGEYSKSGEFIYDRPFQWGSKRLGPDLHREGLPPNKKSDSWHYYHMENPRATSPGSIMPSYKWLLTDKLDMGSTEAKISTMMFLGTPYPDGYAQKSRCRNSSKTNC
jgi:cytochrome c oxidase cbb3-type subunit I/II